MAADTLTVIVYGGGEIFRQHFTAIVNAFGGSGFAALKRIAIAVAAGVTIYGYITKRDLMTLLRWFGLYYLVMGILFAPQLAINVVDRLDHDHPYEINNVPLGLAVLASYSSIIGDTLTNILETNFSTLQKLYYKDTGMAVASRLAAGLSRLQIPSPKFNANLQSFINQCVFYDLLLHKYSMDDLINAENAWNFVASKASPERNFLYNEKVLSCSGGVEFLNADWNAAFDQVTINFSERIFPLAADAKAMLLTYLIPSFKFLTDISIDLHPLLQQHLMYNAIVQAVAHFSSAASPLALPSLTAPQDTLQSEQRNIGDMATNWLPLIKNSGEILLYGCFIFVVLFTFIPISGPKILLRYIYMLLWLQLWTPLLACINFVCSSYARSESLALIEGAKTLPLKNILGLWQVNQDMTSMAGYLSLGVPLLAAGIIKGLVVATEHAVQQAAKFSERSKTNMDMQRGEDFGSEYGARSANGENYGVANALTNSNFNDSSLANSPPFSMFHHSAGMMGYQSLTNFQAAGLENLIERMEFRIKENLRETAANTNHSTATSQEGMAFAAQPFASWWKQDKSDWEGGDNDNSAPFGDAQSLNKEMKMLTGNKKLHVLNKHLQENKDENSYRALSELIAQKNFAIDMLALTHAVQPKNMRQKHSKETNQETQLRAHVGTTTKDITEVFTADANQQFYAWLAKQPAINSKGYLGEHAAKTMANDSPELFSAHVQRFIEMHSAKLEA